MVTHILQPTRENLRGCFSRNHAPILTIEPGDSVRCGVLDATWGLEPLTTFTQPRSKLEAQTPDDTGHCMIGPIAVRGAQAGMTLEVVIGEIRPGAYGHTLAGGWQNPINARLGVLEGDHIHAWTLDADRMVGQDQFGHRVTLRPFMGVMGVAPPEQGVHSTIPPRRWGGNMDCKALTTGVSLFLPVGVEGALFYVGDGHAAQGDGEVSVTAIECPMDVVAFTFRLHDAPLTMPRARTADAWITFGFHESMNEASFQALEEMLDLITSIYQLDRRSALALASLCVDLRVTQIVNQVCGVHAVLPFAAAAGWKAP
jgi:acetamidase/formamidase